tara:strand:+ start:2659 stop:2931 length:273 start_codon:yes stop_codon:yes gene_type:complete
MVATKSDRTKSRDKEPLDVELTLSFRFGDEADDKITMIDNRRIPMVGSVFEKRDLLIRNFVKLMVKAGVSQPKVVRELLPAVRLLRRKQS